MRDPPGGPSTGLYCPLRGLPREECDHCIKDLPTAIVAYCTYTGNGKRKCACQDCDRTPSKETKPKAIQKSVHVTGAEDMLNKQRLNEEQTRHYNNEKLTAVEKAALKKSQAGQAAKRKALSKHVAEKTTTFRVSLGKVKYHAEVAGMVLSLENASSGGYDVRAFYCNKSEDIITNVLFQMGQCGKEVDDFDLIYTQDKSKIPSNLTVGEYSFIGSKAAHARKLSLCLKNGTWLIEPLDCNSSPATSPPSSRTATQGKRATNATNGQQPSQRARPHLILDDSDNDEVLTSDADFIHLYAEQLQQQRQSAAIEVDDDDDEEFPRMAELPPSLTLQNYQSQRAASVAPSDAPEEFHDAIEPNDPPISKRRKTEVSVPELMTICATMRPPPITFQERAGPMAESFHCYNEDLLGDFCMRPPDKSGSSKDIWLGVRLNHPSLVLEEWVLKCPKSHAPNGEEIDGNLVVKSELYIREVAIAVLDEWSTLEGARHIQSPRMLTMELNGCTSPLLKEMESKSKIWVLEKMVRGVICKIINNEGYVSDDDVMTKFPKTGKDIVRDAESLVHLSHIVLHKLGNLLDIELGMVILANGGEVWYLLDPQVCAWGETDHDFQRLFGYGNAGEKAHRTFLMMHRSCGVFCPKGPDNQMARPKDKMTMETTLYRRIGAAPAVSKSSTAPAAAPTTAPVASVAVSSVAVSPLVVPLASASSTSVCIAPLAVNENKATSSLSSVSIVAPIDATLASAEADIGSIHDVLPDADGLSVNAGVSTPVSRLTRYSRNRMEYTIPAFWKLAGTYPGPNGAIYAAIIPASDSQNPVAPDGWRVDWRDDGANFYLQPLCPPDYQMGWSTSNEAWYFVKGEETRWDLPPIDVNCSSGSGSATLGPVVQVRDTVATVTSENRKPVAGTKTVIRTVLVKKKKKNKESTVTLAAEVLESGNLSNQLVDK